MNIQLVIVIAFLVFIFIIGIISFVGSLFLDCTALNEYFGMNGIRLVHAILGLFWV
jgi:hypothetical protein